MTPFSLILNLLIHYFHKILDPIGSKFVSHAEPGYRIFDEVPPTPRVVTTLDSPSPESARIV